MKILSIFFLFIFLMGCEDRNLKNQCKDANIEPNNPDYDRCMESYSNMFAYTVKHEYDELIERTNEYNKLVIEYNSTNSLIDESQYEEIDIEEFTNKYEIYSTNFDTNIDEIVGKKIKFNADFSFDWPEDDLGSFEITINDSILLNTELKDLLSEKKPQFKFLYYFNSAFQNYELREKANNFERLFWIHYFFSLEEFANTEDVKFYGYFVYDKSFTLTGSIFLTEQIEFPLQSFDGYLENYVTKLQDRITDCETTSKYIDGYIDLVDDLFEIKLDRNSGPYCNYD